MQFNIIDFFKCKVIGIDYKESNIHLNINDLVIIFAVPSKELIEKWDSYLYKDVEIYSEVIQDSKGKILSIVNILDLQPIEILNKEKVEKDFNSFVKELDIHDFTQKILDMRNE